MIFIWKKGSFWKNPSFYTNKSTVIKTLELGSWIELTIGRHPIISTALFTFLSSVVGLTFAFLCFAYTIFCVCTNFITPTFRDGFSSGRPIQFETCTWINIIHKILMNFWKMEECLQLWDLNFGFYLVKFLFSLLQRIRVGYINFFCWY